MASASETHPTDRHLSEIEFEELLQRTWELVHNKAQQPIVHPYETATESPSWT
jgi:hypothetical protein